MLYDKWLDLLSVPTAEQTDRFAEYVADSHSWYKHLPFFPPGARFVFFLNPHSGCRITTEGARTVVDDVEVSDYLVHHSRLSTQEYRGLFGYWDYWVTDNSRAIDQQSGPWLYSFDGSHKESMADDLKCQWSCRLTAFLKPAMPMFRLRATELELEADEFMASILQSPKGLLADQTEDTRADGAANRRYTAMARALRRAAGTDGDAAVWKFVEAEASAQRDLLRHTIRSVRFALSNRR